MQIYLMNITNAHIGIFAGKRSGLSHDRTFIGGVIKVSGSEFENNYVDIMFSEWSFGKICDCLSSPDGQIWQSSITGNNFLGLSDDPFCEEEDPENGGTTNYIDHILAYYAWYYATHPGPYLTHPHLQAPVQTPARCHIIDLSPYNDVWDYECQPSCPYGNLYCPKDAKTSGVSGNITDNNNYTNPCATIPPNDYN